MFLLESTAVEIITDIAWMIGGFSTVPALGAIVTFLYKLWKERSAVFDKISAVQVEIDTRLEKRDRVVDGRLSAGEVRFAKIEHSLAEVNAAMKTQENRAELTHHSLRKLEAKVDKVDDRLDKMAVDLAASSAKLDQATDTILSMSSEFSRFMTDSAPGRGITAKLKKAVREVVRPEALAKPEDTLYPDNAPEDDVYNPMVIDQPRRKSAPAMQPVDKDTQEVPKPPAGSVDGQRKTQPPRGTTTKPRSLMPKRNGNGEG